MMMTDNEIVKALENCCSDIPNCLNCQFDADTITCDQCMGELMQKSLDLINRQKAEIEGLRKALDVWKDLAYRETQYVEQAKTEAYKELAEKLKVVAYVPDLSFVGEPVVDVEDIDDLVKELSEVSDNA